MAKKNEKEVLEVGVDVEKALQDMTKMERATKRNFSEVAKAVDKLNGVNKRASKAAQDGNDDWQAGLEDLTKAYKDEGKAIEDVLENIELLSRKAATAGDEEKKAILESIQMLKKKGALQIKALRGKENKEGRVMADSMFKDARGELKSALKDTISSVFSKDLKGIVENSTKTLVKGLKLSAGAGLKLSHMGGGMMSRGKERGGMGGAAMQAGGGAMKGIGAMMGGIKPLIDTLTKIGPILGAIGGAALSLVKIFLDMDAKVKDFNKDVLASSGNTDFLTRSAGNADTAFDKMSDTLDGIRDAAYEWSNIQLGITPDEYKGMINALGQEGVSIARIRSEADAAGVSVQAFTSDLAHVSVAYSRAFGVPLQEINQLQSEMMTEMGADLTQTKVAFQQMNKAAQDSGISANKFFGMIRGVSQDLSLWGTRMEDAVKLLGRLGQVMNPRNAAKFMQSATQGLKNMGRTERLRLSLLTGQGKMGKLVDRDIKRKADGLAKSFGMSGEEVMKKISSKEGRGELEGKIQKMDPSQQGALREALIDAQLQADRRKKGTFGTATAARTLGPAAALEAMQGALVKFGGGKKLSDIVGTIGGEMMAENLGISEDQLDQMAKFESSIDNQREVLKKQLAEGTDAQKQAARDALKKADVTGKTDKELAENIDKAGYDQIMDTLSDGDKLEAQGASKAEIMSAKQADLQTSMLSKMSAIFDWLTNQLYNLLMGIWDTISSFPGLGGDPAAKDHRDAMKRVSGKDTELQKVLNAKDFNSALASSGISTSLSTAMASIPKAIEERDKLNSQMNGADPEQQKVLANRIDALNKQLDASTNIRSSFLKGFDSKDLLEAAKMAGMSKEQMGKVSTLTNPDLQGKSAGEAIAEVFSDADIAKIIDKAVWTSATQGRKTDAYMAVEKQLSDAGLLKGGAVAKAAAPTASASARPAGGGPASTPTAPAPPPEVKDQAAAAQDTLALTKDQASTMASIDNQMDKFKMDTSFLSGPYSKAVEGSVLKAVRTALFEYYMYKDLDQADVVETMRSGGFTASTIGGALVDKSMQTGLVGDNTLDALKPHAAGGMVTGVSNGIAVTAAAGEGLASVGVGERIVPRGGGSSNTPVNVTVNGIGGEDLRRIIEAKVIDGIHEYKRKERFH